MDRNESFEIAKGGIAKLCKSCQLYDPLTHRHDKFIDTRNYIRRTKQFFFPCSMNIIIKLQKCGITGFCELTTTDHRGLYMDISHHMLLKNKTIEFPSPFNSKIQSKCHISVRF